METAIPGRTRASWWQEITPEPKVRIRWLGVFTRKRRLEPGLPKLLVVPTPRHSQPGSIRLEDEFSPADCLAVPAEWNIGDARNLISAAADTGGSVTLAGVLLNDVPTEGHIVRHAAGRLGSSTPAQVRPTAHEIPLAKRLALLLQAPASLLLNSSGPLEWPHQLFDYQLQGVQALVDRNVLLLADDMGLGKTIQAAAALRILVLQRKVESALLLVPVSLVSQWRRELALWAPELRVSTIRGPIHERAYLWRTSAQIYLTGYETFRSDFTENPDSALGRYWDLVVLDEAQRIKNRDSEVSLKCKRLARRRAWALTGTPLENRVDDLASIMEFTTARAPAETPLFLFTGPAMLDRHRSVQLRRKKSEVLTQLPPKTVTEVVLPLEGSQKESYELAEREGVVQLRERGETIRIENVLALILQLKKICNFCPRTGESAKLDDVRARLEVLTSEGHRALIFSQFVDPNFGVHALLKALPDLHPLSYTGAMTASQREDVLKRFAETVEHKVLILSLRAGGQGLNLQDASYVFHFDRWWNPAVERQAEDRVHRLGQRFPVQVYKYLLEGTIEERIDHLLKAKQRLFDEFVDDVTVDLRRSLTPEELFGLFGLSSPKSAPSETTDQPASPQMFETMSGQQFEIYVKGLLEQKGWSVETTPVSRDGGVDLIGRRIDELGIESCLWVQCKNHKSPVGVEVVRALNGCLPENVPGVRGAVVCPSGFTSDAQAFAKGRGIFLWTREDLFKMGTMGTGP